MSVESVENKPVAKKYVLQEGNFLSEEYASLRLRIEEAR